MENKKMIPVYLGILGIGLFFIIWGGNKTVSPKMRKAPPTATEQAAVAAGLIGDLNSQIAALASGKVEKPPTLNEVAAEATTLPDIGGGHSADVWSSFDQNDSQFRIVKAQVDNETKLGFLGTKSPYGYRVEDEQIKIGSAIGYHPCGNIQAVDKYSGSKEMAMWWFAASVELRVNSVNLCRQLEAQ